MTSLKIAVGISLIHLVGVVHCLNAADDPVPTSAEKAALQSLPEGFIVYGTGEKSGDDGKAYGIYKIDMQETTPVRIAELGRAPMIHPSDPSKIVYSEPVAPESDQYNIVVIDFEGDNRQVITKSPMPNVMFVSWTDRGEFLFTSSDLLPVYNDPLKMYHLDPEGTVTHIPTAAVFTTSDGGGGGIDGAFMFKNRVLLRHHYEVGLYEISQDNLSAGITDLVKIADAWTCGAAIGPNWEHFAYNATHHVAFVEKKTDDDLTPVARHDAPKGWANDFAWSNEYEWAIFTLEKTNDCSEDLYVYNLEKKQVVRHSWLACGTYPHNPDMWIGPTDVSSVSKPAIDAEPYLIGDSITVPVSCRTEGASIFYTLDGTEPTQESTPYTEPIVVREDSTTLTVRAFKEGLDPSRLASLTFYRELARKLDNPSNVVPGISYAYYEGSSDNGGFDALTPTKTGVLDSVSLAIPDRAADRFSAVFTGFISIPSSGFVEFSLTSDDGSRLFIGDSLLIDNWGWHGAETKTATMLFETGLHAIRIEYSENDGDQQCTLGCKGNGFSHESVPASALFHIDPNADPVITLVSPAEDQSFSLGSKLAVSWNYSKGSDVVVELSTDDGKPDTWERLSRVTSTTGTTHFEWTVPNDPRYVTKKARTHLFDYNKIMVETVSSAFTINPSNLSLRGKAEQSREVDLRVSNEKLLFHVPSIGNKTPRVRVLTADGRTAYPPVHLYAGNSFACDLATLENGVFFVTILHGNTTLTRQYVRIR